MDGSTPWGSAEGIESAMSAPAALVSLILRSALGILAIVPAPRFLSAQSVEDITTQIRSRVAAGDLAAALPLAERAIALDQGRWESHYTLAVVLLGLHRFDAARVSAERAVALAPVGDRPTARALLQRARPKDRATAEEIGYQRLVVDSAVAELRSVADRPAAERPDLYRRVLQSTERATMVIAEVASVWQVRAIAALELDSLSEGRRAGIELMRLGAATTQNESLRGLLAALVHRGWVSDESSWRPAYEQRLVDGERSLLSDDLEGARRAVAAADQLYPGAPDVEFLGARCALAAGDLAAARPLLERARMGGYYPTQAMLEDPLLAAFAADTGGREWMRSWLSPVDFLRLDTRRRYLYPASGLRAAPDAKIDQATGLPTHVTHTRTGISMRLVRGGAFTMGSPPTEGHRDPDESLHEVSVATYYLGEAEVSQREWQSIMGSENPSQHRGPDLPVDSVSWHAAVKFCELSGSLRLPTEAEWEHACRGGTRSAYSTGDSLDSAYACFSAQGGGATPDQPLSVRSLKANAWGFYDMHGNVWEWCQDEYAPYGVGRSTSGREGAPRTLRGGSWLNASSSCRSADRGALAPEEVNEALGFRVAATPRTD